VRSDSAHDPLPLISRKVCARRLKRAVDGKEESAEGS